MPTNSTNGRSAIEAPRLLQFAIGVSARIAPRFTERQAARRFITPKIRPGKSPTQLHQELLPERAMQRRAGEAEPAYPELSTGRIPLWSWGRGPTVLLVHGWSGSGASMAPLAASFVRAGYRAVMIDMPGHGTAARSPTNLYVYIRTLEALAPLLGPLDTVVGHSLGGCAVSIALGNGLLTARRAALVAPALSPWAFSWHFAKMIGLPAERVPGMVAATEELVGASADSLNAAEAVAKLDIPAFIVHDPEDRDVPFDHSTGLAAAWKGAVLVPRPGLGHRRILKDEETLRRIVKFARGERTTDARALVSV